MITRITRRKALRTAGMLVGGAVLAACAPAPKEVIKEVTKEVVKEVVKESTVVKQATVVVKETVAPTKRKPVKVMHFYGSGARRDGFDKLANMFNEQSSAHLVELSYAPFADIAPKLLAGISAGDAPETFLASGMNDPADTYCPEGQLLPIDDYYIKSTLPKWQPGNWVPYTLEEGQLIYKGKMYGLPWMPETRLLFCDVKSFQEVGLDPKKPPRTMEDLVSYADKLDKGQKGSWKRIGFNPKWGQAFPHQWLWTMGFDEWAKKDSDNIPVLDQPEVREILQWILMWRDRYGHDDLAGVASQYAGTTDPFVSGANPMRVNGTWQPGEYRKNKPDFKIVYAPHPIYPGAKGKSCSWGCGQAICMPIKSKNPEGAWAWIEHILQFDSLMTWVKASECIPPRMDVLSDPSLPSLLGEYWTVALEQLKTTRNFRFTGGAQPAIHLIDAMNDLWDGGGKATVEQVLARHQDAMKKEVLDWRKAHPNG